MLGRKILEYQVVKIVAEQEKYELAINYCHIGRQYSIKHLRPY